MFWVAVSTNVTGHYVFEFGLNRFPWTRLFETKLPQDYPVLKYFGFVALGPPNVGLSSWVRSITVETGVTLDRASRDHVVFLTWSRGDSEPPEIYEGSGLELVYRVKHNRIFVVCESSRLANSVCASATQDGWEARCVSRLDLVMEMRREKMAAKWSIAEAAHKRVSEMENDVDMAIQLGLIDLADSLGSSPEEADYSTDSLRREEVAVTSAPTKSVLRSDAQEFTPVTAGEVAVSGEALQSIEKTSTVGGGLSSLSAEAPAFSPRLAKPEDGDSMRSKGQVTVLCRGTGFHPNWSCKPRWCCCSFWSNSPGPSIWNGGSCRRPCFDLLCRRR